MHEFETFCYLDVQKTGSTFVSYLLTQCSTEKALIFRKHLRVEDRYDPNKFYFITVRDPLDQYISLYSHGCGGAGGLSRRLRKRGHGNLYDSTWSGFRRWIKFVMREDNAELLDDDYGSAENEALRELIGFQTYRFLELAMLEPLETLRRCKTRDDVRAAYKEKDIVDFTVRHEHFDEDMELLLTTKLRYAMKDADEAVKLLHETKRLNESDRVDRFEEDPKMGHNVRIKLNEKEWLLKELFDY
jgi:hypothetical protein